MAGYCEGKPMNNKPEKIKTTAFIRTIQGIYGACTICDWHTTAQLNATGKKQARRHVQKTKHPVRLVYQREWIVGENKEQ